MTIHPQPRPTANHDDLDDVFSAIIPTEGKPAAEKAEKPKAQLKSKKMDPLQRRLSMMSKRDENRKTEIRHVAKPTRTTKVSFSPYNRHHPYNPSTRVASSLKQAVSYSTSTPNLGETSKGHILAHATPSRSARPTPSVKSTSKDATTPSSTGSSPSVVGSTPTSHDTSIDTIVPSSEEVLPTPSGPTASTPINRNPLQPNHIAPGSISLVKSILKRKRDTPIRIAATVEEGTRENTEQTRLGMSSPSRDGQSTSRPGLKATDSFQLLLSRSSRASDGTGVEITGKEAHTAATTSVVEEISVVLGSDDTITSDNGEGRSTGQVGKDGNDDAEKEESGNNADDEKRQPSQGSGDTSAVDSEPRFNSVDSLLDIIINETDDLLAVEDAYGLIQARYRKLFAENRLTVENTNESELDSALKSFQSCSSDLYRSFIRDISRLIGAPISTIPPPILDSSPPPGEHLDPTKGTISPSPSPEGNHRLVNFGKSGKNPVSRVPMSPTLGIARLSSSTNAPASPKPTRQGYSEAEVRYRRALAGVGQASLRFLAFVLHRSELHKCLSEADITSLISTVLVIPTTPKLYTANPKKSYALAMYSLCHLQVPVPCIQPVKEKFMRVITFGLGEGGLKCWGGGPGKQEGEGGNVKARFECFAAMANALVQYPSLFLPRHKDYIPLILSGLIDSQPGMKTKAGTALCSLMKGKTNWLKDTDKALKDAERRFAKIEPLEEQEKEHLQAELQAAINDWKLARKVVTESEITTQNFLKSTLKYSSSATNTARTKVWDAVIDLLQRMLTTDPLWACTIWSCIVSMLGQVFLRDSTRYREMNSMILSVLGGKEQQENCPGRTILCRIAWNHTIYAILDYRSQQYIDEASATPRRYYDLNYSIGEKMMTAILSLPSEVRRKEEELADVAEIVVGEDGKREWIRKDSLSRRIWLRTCANSVTPIIYAYTGAILRSIPPPNQADDKQNDEAATKSLVHDRLDIIFDKIIMEFLPSMLNVRALDEIKIEAWGILQSLVQHSSVDKLKSWSMNRLLCDAFFRHDTINKDPTPAYRDRICQESANDIIANGIQAGDIPAWTTESICDRFVGGFGVLFVDAMKSMRGIERHEVTGDWVTLSGEKVELPLIPRVLSELWENLLHHVSQQTTGDRAFQQCLAEVTRILVDLYKSDVASYTPLALENAVDYDAEVRKLQICHYLTEIAVKTLPDSTFAQTRLTLNPPANISDSSVPLNVIGADSAGNPTSTGYLLHHVIHSPLNNSNLTPEATESHLKLLAFLLSQSITGSNAKRILGQCTYALNTLADSNASPDIIWGIWSMLCQSWSSYLGLNPMSNHSRSGSNHTIGLLTSLLSLPFQLCAGHSSDDNWTVIWHEMFAVACSGSERRQQPFLLSVVEPICKSIIGLYHWQHLILNDEAAWSCIEAMTFRMDGLQCGREDVPLSFFTLVDQLGSQDSAEDAKLSQLLSAALVCTSIESLHLESVQRIWCLALSAHQSPLSNEAETRLTKIVLAELNASAEISAALNTFSPLFRYLLSSNSIQDHNSFRTMWNVSFGKIELRDQDIPDVLQPLLRGRWETDTTTFDMPVWKRSQEASQSTRLAVTTVDYEADDSDEVEEDAAPTNQSSRGKGSKRARHPEGPESDHPQGSLQGSGPSQNSVADHEIQAGRRKGRPPGKRNAKKQRKRSLLLEPKEEESTCLADTPGVNIGGTQEEDSTAIRASKRRKVPHLSSKGAPSISRATEEAAGCLPAGSSTSINRRSSRKSSRNSTSEPPRRQETPAQEADAMDEIEEVLSTPDQPEDRVEVVLPTLDRLHRRPSEAIGYANDKQGHRYTSTFKRSLVPELTAVLHSRQETGSSSIPHSMPRSTRALAKAISAPEPSHQVSALLPSEQTRGGDVIALVRQAASLKTTIIDLETTQINQLMTALEELRSTSAAVLTERFRSSS